LIFHVILEETITFSGGVRFEKNVFL